MHIYRRFMLSSFFCLAVMGLLAQAQQKDAAPTSASTVAASKSVKVDTVSKILISKDNPAYLISYSYDFGSRPDVYIKGIGTVAPKGEYHYISQKQELEFRDPANDSVLARVPLVETTIVADTPPMNEVPSENQFPADYRAFTWELGTSLQERANSVLGQYFNYLPHEHGKVTFLATTYTPLTLERKLSTKGVTALIALLVSFPFDPTTGKYSFHIQSLVKEGRALTDITKPTSDPEILNTAKLFVDTLVSQMKTGER